MNIWHRMAAWGMSAVHSPFFAPSPEPALRTGVTATTDAALELLQ